MIKKLTVWCLYY